MRKKLGRVPKVQFRSRLLGGWKFTAIKIPQFAASLPVSTTLGFIHKRKKKKIY
jgi:hypothetical protein